LKPKWAQPRKGKRKTVIVVQDLGSDSKDDSKVTTMGFEGKSFVASFISCASSSKDNVIPEGSKKNYLFIYELSQSTLHTKIDTLVDSGSQVNLISEQVVKNLGLETRPHLRPYHLGWIFDNAQLHVTKKCKLRFAITSSFTDEVELDVVPFDICEKVLGSPYLYDRNVD
jgi:hypothetical protein